MNLEEWRRYVDEQIKKAKQAIQAEKIVPPPQQQEKEIIKEEKEEMKKEEESIEEKKVDAFDTFQIVIQKDKKLAELPEKERIEVPLEDPIEVLIQRDKKVKEIEELKGKEPPPTTREELLNRLLDPHITLEEAAIILKVSKQTVRRYTDQNLLPHIRTAGGQRRFKLSDVLTFLEKQGEKITRDTINS